MGELYIKANKENGLLHDIVLVEEPEGGYTAITKGFPGCTTVGDTVEEAIRMAKEAQEVFFEMGGN